jgi:16S rRNA (uracil1498-N3)-methyltransferase
MRLTRVYVAQSLAAGGTVTLEGAAASHLTRVLRARAGEPLTLFNGEGGEYAARILRQGGGKVTVEVGLQLATERESPLALTLAQGVARGERMDLVVQKATELGVARLAPLLTERSVVRLSATQAQKKLAHWRLVAVAACEQSGRNRLPEIAAPQTLDEFLSSERAAESPPLRLLLSPDGPRQLSDLPRSSCVTVLVGPEGGLTQQERECAIAAGFLAVRLGPRVLRTETAALVAVALLQRQFGDL